jgi:glycosyltransferase involved in cell wall biosynthesis
MRILHLISSGGYYGAENMLVTLVKSLDGLGHHSVLGLFANVHHPNDELLNVARTDRLSHETILCNGRMDRRAARATIDCIERNQIDVVHSHGYKADLYALLAASRCDVPLVATCHNWTRDSLALHAYQLVDGMCLRHFNAVIAVSSGVADVLRRLRVPPQKVTTIANGVVVSAFAAARPTISEVRKRDGLVVGMVARLMPKKGHEYLLRCAPGVLAEFPDTVFVFAGEGALRSELESLAQQLGIRNNVIFLGQRGDMPGVYASMDIVVLPSLNEGMPMSVLESLAAGKPVIATRVGDVPRVILHEETGLLVNSEDVGDLRSAILRLAGRPELRRKLATNGLAHLQRHWSAEAMARNYEAVYSRLLAR